MEIALGVVAIIVVVGLLYLWLRKAGSAEGPAPDARDERKPAAGPLITLDLEVSDPESPIVQRLMNDAASQYFAAHPDSQTVEVRDSTGKTLGYPTRKAAEEAKDVNVPDHLYEPQSRRQAGGLEGHLAEEGAGGAGGAQFDTSGDAPHRSLADLFDLPPDVRSRVQRPNDPVDLCRAIVEAAGLQANVTGDVVKVGDEALVVIDTGFGSPVRNDDLSQAFLRFQESGAKKGVVVSPGLMYPQELKRRQAMAPNLLHAGPEGIQRMADAVALGANPMRFVTGPPVG